MKLFSRLILLVLWCGFGTPVLPAQPSVATNPPPITQDPLLQLMLSQPRLDFAAPVSANAMFDPPTGRAGDQGIFRVTINALEQSIDWPEKLPSPAGLTWEPGARGQVLQMTPAGVQPRTTFNYRVTAKEPGTFSVPEFTVNVYGKPVRIPAAQWPVRPTEASPPQLPEKLILEFPETNLFIGQPATARIVLRGSLGGVVQGISQVQINGRGLLVDMGSVRQRIESTGAGGIATAAYVFETLVTPMNAGDLEVYAQGFTVGNRFAGPITITGTVSIPGGQPQYTLLESDPLRLRVLPLPRAGELPGFTGAIGEFFLDPPRLSTNVTRVGDPVKLTVHVRTTDGRPARIAPPPPPRLPDWQVLAGSGETSGPRGGAQPVTVFEYTLIPLATSSTRTPVIPFSYFDPARKQHRDLSIPGLPLIVLTNSEAGEAAALLAAAKLESNRPEDLKLQPLSAAPGYRTQSLVPLQERSWFPLVQAAPAALFLGLWFWDRRRRFLEAHPDLVRRRKALRRLKHDRQRLGYLARDGETIEFARAAVLAMQNAVAPHFPAEPRALVCGDVLEVLARGPEINANATETVRELFLRSDAAAYSPNAEGRASRPLRPALDSILDQLEQALRTGLPKRAIMNLPANVELDLLDRNSAGTAIKTSLIVLTAGGLCIAAWAASGDPFAQGVAAYQEGRYADSAAAFRASAAQQPAAGTLQNLGNAEWLRNRIGSAVLAWEQSLWVDPRHQASRLNLDYARKIAQLESPELSWNEVLSSWLPHYWWAWAAGLSLWTAIGMLTLPGILRQRREGWHQAVAALALGVFLLSVPAHLGGHTRTRLGFVQLPNTNLRLTPTTEAQVITLLAPGEPVRRIRARGEFILVETSRSKGWIKAEEAGFLTQLAER